MTVMPIRGIKIFIDWCMQGDATLQERYDMFMERKEMVEKQIPESAYTNNNGES